MELALADLASVDKQLNKYTKQARSGGDKEALKLVTVWKRFAPYSMKANQQEALTYLRTKKPSSSSFVF